LYADLRGLDERVRELDKEIRAIGCENEAVGRVQELRGIGPLIASALVAMIGDARQFKNGRQVAVALGLTPRQHSSGSKERILGISKRGDSYVRTLLIHGARSALRTAPGKNDRMSRWALALAKRSHINVAVTALANKMARVAWAMLKHGTNYEPNGLAAWRKRARLRRRVTTVASTLSRWRTGRTGASKTRECPRASSPTKQWGAGARIAHRGPTSVDRGQQ
jgi:hypothetical protein